MHKRNILDEYNYCKAECGDPLSTEENRAILIQMLDALANACTQNGLEYTLSGGTLLGARRHKGFIPWDDDIDVNMPRPDINKLYEITGGKIGKYILAAPGDDRFTGSFFRVYDPDTIMENGLGIKNSKPIYNPVFIDIFPVEGLPDSVFLTKIYYAFASFLRKTMRVAQRDHVAAKTKKQLILNYIGFLPARIFGYDRLVRWFQRFIQLKDFNKSNYVGVMSASKYTIQERISRIGYTTTIDVEFEGKLYKGPSNYDQYLTQLYGDYMKMPPIEKQQTHHTFNVFRKKSSVAR